MLGVRVGGSGSSRFLRINYIMLLAKYEQLRFSPNFSFIQSFENLCNMRLHTSILQDVEFSFD